MAVAENVRRPVAAGVFYEASPEALRGQLEWALGHPLASVEPPAGRVEAVLVPHGGIFFAGPLIAAGARALASSRPGLVVILAPNHTGLGPRVSVYPGGAWETPLGRVEVDAEAARLLAEASGAELEQWAHIYEHSVEVVLVVLQYVLGGGFRVVPVVVLDQSRESMEGLVEALLGLRGERGDKMVVVATSNLSQYVPREKALRVDAELLEALRSDPWGLGERARGLGVSICGAGVASAAAVYASRLGASMTVLGHATSGDVGGHVGPVVGYASVAWVASGGGQEVGGEE